MSERLVFGTDPTAKKKKRQENDDPLRQRSTRLDIPAMESRECCQCGTALPAGHRYLCLACGQQGYEAAEDTIARERLDRLMNGLPEHGGGRWLESKGVMPVTPNDDGKGPSSIASAWRHGVDTLAERKERP